jgi:hypothetical protein
MPKYKEFIGKSSSLFSKKKKRRRSQAHLIQQYVSITNSSRRVGNRSESTCICHMILQYYSTVCGVFDCIWISAWNRHLTCLSLHISFSNTSTLSLMWRRRQLRLFNKTLHLLIIPYMTKFIWTAHNWHHIFRSVHRKLHQKVNSIQYYSDIRTMESWMVSVKRYTLQPKLAGKHFLLAISAPSTDESYDIINSSNNLNLMYINCRCFFGAYIYLHWSPGSLMFLNSLVYQL